MCCTHNMCLHARSSAPAVDQSCMWHAAAACPVVAPISTVGRLKLALRAAQCCCTACVVLDAVFLSLSRIPACGPVTPRVWLATQEGCCLPSQTWGSSLPFVRIPTVLLWTVANPLSLTNHASLSLLRSVLVALMLHAVCGQGGCIECCSSPRPRLACYCCCSLLALFGVHAHASQCVCWQSL